MRFFLAFAMTHGWINAAIDFVNAFCQTHYPDLMDPMYMLKYLFLVVTRQFLASVYALLLSSNIVPGFKIIALNSSVQLVNQVRVLINVMIDNIMHVADDNAEYSASRVDSDTSEINGHNPKMIA